MAVSLAGTDPACFGTSTGSITSTVIGGTAPYTYAYSNGATTADISGLAAGAYSVTVTDANGCIANAVDTLSQPNLLTATASATNVTCFGGFDGTASATPTGGTAPYTYHWSNNASTRNISGLFAGTYRVTVTDAHGCIATAQAQVQQPGPLTLGANTTPVSCNGGNNGAIDLRVTGGTAPYTYTWSTGDTTQDLAGGLIAGTYNVTVVDAHRCNATVAIVVNQPLPLQLTLTPVGPSCTSGASGSITSQVSGGTLPNQYSWSNGATAADLTNIAAGNYSVTVTDANGCSVSDATTVSPSGTLHIALTPTDPSCYGSINGSITSTITGGSGNYTYTWSNGAATADISGLGAGTYKLNVVDVFGCAGADSVTLSQPNPLTVALTDTDAACFGTATGSVQSIVTGGTTPYAYLWSNGAITANINALAAGTYNVTVTDAHGCVASAAAADTVTEPNLLTATATSTPVSCFGGFDGTASVTPTGGTAPYTYHWSNNASTLNITGLFAGTYRVTITDAHGCTYNTLTTVQQPGPLTLGANTTPVSCYNGSNGAIDLIVTGGTAPYTYTWSTGDTTQDLAGGLIAGTYNVTVVDAHRCNATVAILVQQPLPLTLTLTPVGPNCAGTTAGSVSSVVAGGTIPNHYVWSTGDTTANISNVVAGTYSLTVTDANSCVVSGTTTVSPSGTLAISLTAGKLTCNGAGNGSVTSTISGGSGIYTYAWSNGATTANINGLAAGTYTLSVYDAFGCTGVDSARVNQPNVLAVSLTGTDVACFGGSTGSVTSTVTGGTAAYTYFWSNGATTANLNNVAIGNYNVVVTDANGCTATAAAADTVTQPALLVATATSTPVSCFGGFDGTASALAAGGTAPYTYHWSTGANRQNITGLFAGSYRLTVTDAHGCTGLYTVQVGQPGPLTLGANTVPVSCFGGSNGSIDLSVTGGTPGYVYTWSTGATTQDIAGGLAAATYNVTVVDAHNCNATVAILVQQPLPLSLTLNPVNPSCGSGNTGSISTTVVGGTSPYHYAWSNQATTANIGNIGAGTYSVVVTDTNGCQASNSTTLIGGVPLNITLTPTAPSCNGGSNGSITSSVSGGVQPYTYAWSNGATTANISGLAAGSYTVTVTDALGCSSSANIVVTQPASLSIGLTVTNAACFGSATGAVTSTVTGGTAPYTYLWNTQATSANLSNLAIGSYSVTVTDAHGCVANSAASSVSQPTALTDQITATMVNCIGAFDGTVTTRAGGGTAPYTYRWSNNATTAGITGLPVGTYKVTITDANGCSRIDSAAVNQPGPITLGATTTPVNCNGTPTGSITLIALGPNMPFTFRWSNGATTKNISGLVAGTYTVTATNTHGCSATVSITVIEPAPISLTASITSACIITGGGAINLSVTGGTVPFSYTWSNGATTEDINQLTSGIYGVTAADQNGCKAMASFTVGDSICGGGGGIAPRMAAPKNLAASNLANSDNQEVITESNTTSGNNTVTTEPMHIATQPNSPAAKTETAMKCYPNPFSSKLTVEYNLTQADHVKIDVLDVVGNNVATLFNNELEAGTYKTSFEPGNINNGIYLIRVQIGEQVQTQKAILYK